MHDLNEGVIPETVATLLEAICENTPTGNKSNFDSKVKEQISKLKLLHGNVSLERANSKY